MSATRTTIFRDAVPSVAGVSVDELDTIGTRYAVHKMIKVGGENVRRSACYYTQRLAAVRYARKWLAERAKVAGTTYTPGSGVDTMLFKPVGIEVRS